MSETPVGSRTDSRHRQSFFQRAALGWLAFLTRLLPEGFRRRFGDDLLLAFEDWLAAEEPATLGTAWWASRATAVLLRTAVAERLDPTVWSVSATSPVPALARGNMPPARLRYDYGRNQEKGSAMDRILQDLRFAARSLSRRPGYVLVAVLTLALGVGANAAIFSVVDAVVLRPLPYADPHELVIVERIEDRQPGERNAMSRPDIDDVRAAATTLRDVVAYFDTSVTLTGDGEPEVLQAASVSGDLLRLFQLEPVRGRDLTLSDQGPARPLVAVISHGLWQSRFGGEEGIVGRIVVFDDESHEIVGVAPPNFQFPRRTAVWTNLMTDPEECGRGCHLMRAVARLAPNNDVAAAGQELAVIAQRLASEYPGQNRGKTFVATQLADKLVGDARGGLFVLLGAVALVLVIAAANLAGLQLAHGASRRAEMGLRSALGASRSRLVRLMLSETVLVGVAGGVAGVALAWLALRFVIGIAPAGVPRLDEAAVDPRVLAFGLALALLVAVAFGLYPAWRLASAGQRHGGSGQAQRTTLDRSDVRLRTGLLVGEIALSLALLVGAGLLLKTYVGLLSLDLGFDRQQVMSFFVAAPDARYDHPDKVVALFDALEAELVALPEVETVGGILGRPFSGNTIGTSFHLTDQPQPREGEEPDTRIRVVMPGYFDALRIPMISGRSLSREDRQGGQPVAVVNETFVRRYSRDRDPIGREIELGASFGYDEPVRTIVGVVRDVRGESLTEASDPEVYVPQAQMGSVWMSVVLRTRGPEEPWGAVTDAVHRVDPLLPLSSKETLAAAVDRAQGPSRFYFVLLASFAAIALTLAAVGLYGIVSYLVAKRSRELAVRLALGADRAGIVRLVLAQGLRPVALGAALGVVLSLAAARTLSSLLHEVAPFDPLTYAAVTLLLVVVAFVALLGPARRAGRVAPALVLKEE